jgi:hypothetical protein
VLWFDDEQWAKVKPVISEGNDFARFACWSARGIWQQIIETVGIRRNGPNWWRWTAPMSKRPLRWLAQKSGPPKGGPQQHFMRLSMPASGNGAGQCGAGA